MSEFATPTFQDVLKLRRLRAEQGLEPFNPRDLQAQRTVVLGQRAVDLVERVTGEREPLGFEMGDSALGVRHER